MEQSFTLALFGASAGAAVVAAIVLFSRRAEAFAYRAGVVLFALVALVGASNVVNVGLDRPPAWWIQTQGMMSAALFPVAWLYIRDLAADVPRSLARGDRWHFAIPIAFVPHAIWAGLFLSPAAEQSLWVAGPMPQEAVAFAATGVTLTALWAGQISFYTILVIRTLQRLPKRLRTVFADLSGRQLLWLRLILVLFAAHLPLVLAQNLGLMAVPDFVFAGLAAALTCIWAGWGVQQRPVFQATPQDPVRVVVDVIAPTDTEKYAKSLLDDDRLDRIADKIQAAFEKDVLHLDPNLSLAKLAERVSVAENQLSQTFSRRLNTSFFEYVSAKRIAVAKKLLIETDASVVDIAIEAGFNARSAFYNAFKSETGSTPAAFRKEARDSGRSVSR